MSEDSIKQKTSLRDRLAIIVGENTGKSVVDSAIEMLRGEYSKQVIQFTKQTIVNIQNFDKQIELARKYRRFQQRRLYAIEAGKFQVRNGQVIFEEDELNGKL